MSKRFQILSFVCSSTLDVYFPIVFQINFSLPFVPFNFVLITNTAFYVCVPFRSGGMNSSGRVTYHNVINTHFGRACNRVQMKSIYQLELFLFIKTFFVFEYVNMEAIYIALSSVEC